MTVVSGEMSPIAAVIISVLLLIITTLNGIWNTFSVNAALRNSQVRNIYENLVLNLSALLVK